MLNNKSKVSAAKLSHEIPAAEKSNDFYIVGMGASAGGLAAFELFFSAVPSDGEMNMAFVIVQHLDPNHKSFLTGLIQSYTKMKVYEVQDGMEVEANCVYIIPPNREMRLFKGVLHLLEPVGTRGPRLPIDIFFHSLAKDRQSKAIGIILSGTGQDGTEGIKAIKEAGGMAIAQSVLSADFDGMPDSAIATDEIDDILAPSEMPKKLMRHANGKLENTIEAHPFTHDEDTLKKIFLLLESQTSHDFSKYKPNTMVCRIERRLVVNKIDTIEKYYKYLQRSKNEVDTLFNELLIGVTNFFRDEEVFLSLQTNAIPKLFFQKPSGAVIRVWVPGCSTGEEAYSIAILIMEHMQKIKKTFTVQIFATDIDATAIATARAGNYPLSIAANISEERLQNYFVKNSSESAYKIRKNIRDMLVFSTHDVIKDPPFSKLDLISCRNLLIYMNIELQQKLISLFHYALNAEGILLLGSSETLGEFANLYAVLDSKSKLFQGKQSLESIRQSILHRYTPISEVYPSMQQTNRLRPSMKLPLRELTENAILEQIAPAAILVDEYGNILYIHGRAGVYLELPSGETNTNNILKMAREGLRNDLILAFHKVKSKKQVVHVYGVKIKVDGYFSVINITIRALTLGSKLKPEGQLYLVLLEEDLYAPKKEVIQENSLDIDISDKAPLSEGLRITALKQELQLQKEFLQDANEKLETSNEELKSYNEEIQSMNEELQSTNEELETSKEELQSVNEELYTVNAELNAKVMDFSFAINDMNNLLAGTGIGTIFVDYKLNILRFTPAVTRIINLISSDVGRPVGHIVSNLVDYNSLMHDIQSVLDTLVSKEIEVMTIEQKSYLMRIQPYRTLENVIEGAVISFVDITEMHAIREELNKAREFSRLATVVRDSSDAITVEELHGKIIAWNPGAQKLYGWSEAEALQMQADMRIPKELQEKDAKKISELSSSKILRIYKTKRLKKDGSIIDVHIVASALRDENGHIYAIATTERPQEI